MHVQWTDLGSLLTSPLGVFWFVLGTFFGSFFNVCIYRIPLKIFWKNKRSHCPACNALIPFWYNIPLVSWLVLRGRAACCGASISVRYPLVELLSGLLFVTIYHCFPFVLGWQGHLQLDPANFLRFMHAIVFVSLLLICSFIDLQYMIIPDVISLPMIAVTPLVVYLHPDLDWKSALFGILLGGGLFYAVAWLYFLLRREAGLGMGDVKLLAAIGGWLGYQSIITTIFWGSLLGSFVGLGLIVFKGKMSLKTRLPFGPFLSLAAILYLLWGHQLSDMMIAF